MLFSLSGELDSRTLAEPSCSLDQVILGGSWCRDEGMLRFCESRGDQPLFLPTANTNQSRVNDALDRNKVLFFSSLASTGFELGTLRVRTSPTLSSPRALRHLTSADCWKEWVWNSLMKLYSSSNREVESARRGRKAGVGEISSGKVRRRARERELQGASMLVAGALRSWVVPADASNHFI